MEHLVVAVIPHRGDEVLLCHRPPRRRWHPNVRDFPGGHVEPGEDPRAALRREVAGKLGADLPGADDEPLLHRIDPDTGPDLTA